MIQDIEDRFPDTCTYSWFDVLNVSRLPETPEEAMECKYGETQVDKLGKHYGSDNSPYIDAEQLVIEWFNHRTS